MPRRSGWETRFSALDKVSRHIRPEGTSSPLSFVLGGWIPETGEWIMEINAQIDQAFKNVETALKTAGGKGWEQVCTYILQVLCLYIRREAISLRVVTSQVFRINSYHVPICDESAEAMLRNMRKWMPNHKPLWTCIGVPRLGDDRMRVEVEVQAYDPPSKSAA